MNRSLVISAVNLATFTATAIVLAEQLLQDPWDLVAFMVFAAVCPVAGGMLTIRTAARELQQHTGKAWHALLALGIALGVVGYALWACVSGLSQL